MDSYDSLFFSQAKSFFFIEKQKINTEDGRESASSSYKVQ